jgi:hypothetical protein
VGTGSDQTKPVKLEQIVENAKAALVKARENNSSIMAFAVNPAFGVEALYALAVPTLPITVVVLTLLASVLPLVLHPGVLRQ